MRLRCSRASADSHPLLALSLQCKQYAGMAVTITIRNVPDEVRDWPPDDPATIVAARDLDRR